MKKSLNIVVFLYNDFADFEIVQLLLLLRDHSLKTTAFHKKPIKSYTGLTVLPDCSLDELDPTQIDLFLIPGGEPNEIIGDPLKADLVAQLNQLLVLLNNHHIWIAAICGGPVFLANSGILTQRSCTASISEEEKKYFKSTLFRDVDIMCDENVITAKGQAFTEFAVKVSEKLGILTTDTEIQETLNWFRNC